jgi:hypothetical protein
MQETMKRALVLVFFVGTAGLLVNFNATLGRAQEVKRNVYLPQLADLMNESMQTHHAKLWFAGHAGNWVLAAYEVKKIKGTIEEIKETIVDIQTASSHWRSFPVNEMLKNLDSNLDVLDQAINAKDPAKFEAAYQGFTAACNVCHTSAGQSQIKIITPLPNGSSTFPNQDFITGPQ